MTQLGRARHPQLDGLRAIAALGVLVHHHNPGTLVDVPGTWSIYGLIAATASRLALGQVGVTVFFALSAFLLVQQLVEEQELTGRIDVRTFYWRRALRLWPLYALCIGVSLALVGLLAPPQSQELTWDLTHLWFYLGFVSNMSLAFNGDFGYLDQFPPSMSVLWTVAVEQQFYLVVPFIVLLTRKVDKWLILLSISALALICRILFLTVFQSTPPITLNLYYSGTTYADTFLAGGVAGVLVYSHAAFLRKTVSDVRFTLLLVGVSFALFPLLFLPSFGANAWADPVTFGVFGWILAGSVLWLVVHRDSLVSRLLGSRPLAHLGKISYGLYVWHVLVNLAVNFGFQSWVLRQGVGPDSKQALASLALTIGGTVLLSEATYRLVELPVQRFGRREAESRIPLRVGQRNLSRP
jgi:peptidoglycan/LPS O-acetylase OafA/YrhL